MDFELIIWIIIPWILGVAIAFCSIRLSLRSRKILQWVIAIPITLGVLASSGVFYGMMQGAWPTMVPHAIIAVCLLLLAAQYGFYKSNGNPVVYKASLVSAALIAGGITYVVVNIGVEMISVLDVAWKMDEALKDEWGEQVIILEGDNVHMVIASDEIADYLEDENPPTVPLEIKKTYDFGDLRGYSPMRVAGFSRYGWLDGWYRE